MNRNASRFLARRDETVRASRSHVCSCSGPSPRSVMRLPRSSRPAAISSRVRCSPLWLLAICPVWIIFAVDPKLKDLADVAANQLTILVCVAALLGKTQCESVDGQHGIIGFHHQTDTEVWEACSTQHSFCRYEKSD
jgi:hypothetical protein